MAGFFLALDRKAQISLVRRETVRILGVAVVAVPAAGLPPGRLPLKIACSIRHEFAPGDPRVDAKLSRIRGTCRRPGDDFPAPMKLSLCSLLERKQREPEGIRAGSFGPDAGIYPDGPNVPELLRPVVGRGRPFVTLWCLAWTAALDNRGMFVFDSEDCFCRHRTRVAGDYSFRKQVYAEDREGLVLENVMARIGRVNAVMDRIVENVSTR